MGYEQMYLKFRDSYISMSIETCISHITYCDFIFTSYSEFLRKTISFKLIEFLEIVTTLNLIKIRFLKLAQLSLGVRMYDITSKVRVVLSLHKQNGLRICKIRWLPQSDIHLYVYKPPPKGKQNCFYYWLILQS